ncbi:MAG: hypothetical protein U0271_19670 [Polyangiaceae bacterium]
MSLERFEVGLFAVALLTSSCASGTAASSTGPHADDAGPLPTGALAVFAEGPCARLSAAELGGRRVLVYGDTGYGLHDWAAGEKLFAAQTIAELTPAGPRRNPALLRGLPLDERGYVPFSLEVGADSTGRGWLLAVETRYAPRGTGALFVRASTPYSYEERDGWSPREGESVVDLGPELPYLPPLPLGRRPASDSPCGDEHLEFLPLSHGFGRDGSVFVSGRCQDESHLAYADTTLVVARAAPHASAWSFARLPRSNRLDGIVNTATFAVSSKDAWVSAYEPFSPVSGRQSYLVHWDGASFEEVDLGIDQGIMSLAGGEDGALYLAAGRGLFKRDARGAVTEVPLPPLHFVARPPELHVHDVRSFERAGVFELWVEATYRVELSAGEARVSEYASALFSNVQTPSPIFCDAREAAPSALAYVDEEKR